MHAEFWHERWRDGQIGFHEAEGNALFARHFHRLCVPDGGRIFLPLCGKTRDIGWLLTQGYSVVGAELSEVAIRDLFADLRVMPSISPLGAVQHWSAPGIDVFVGDVMALDAATLGPVDAVFDRAALVALPEPMRGAYVRQVARLAPAAPILLVTFEYPDGAIDGPPFSLSDDAIKALYRDDYRLETLEAVPFVFRAGVAAREVARLLSPL